MKKLKVVMGMTILERRRDLQDPSPIFSGQLKLLDWMEQLIISTMSKIAHPVHMATGRV